MSFASASPGVVKSVRQRDLLNGWIRLFNRDRSLSRFNKYEISREDDERADIALFDVLSDGSHLRFAMNFQGRRLAEVFGSVAPGSILGESSGPKVSSALLPAYHACVARGRPIYGIFRVNDKQGRMVAYERLLLPFGLGVDVELIMSSVKMISEDGAFVQTGLMREGEGYSPIDTFTAIIDVELTAPGHARRQIEQQLENDVIEI